MRGTGHHDGRQIWQPFDDLSRLVEPPHLCSSALSLSLN